MLISIQLLRAVAALGVAIAHLYAEFAVFGDRSFPNFIVGAAGVDLFFVISGFVIAYSSERFYAQPKGAITFLLRRLARIVPLYWAATTLFLLYLLCVFRGTPIAEILLINDMSWPVVGTSFVFWPFPRPSGATFPALSLGWTLNYEMFFYVVFTGAVLLPRRIAVLAASAALLALPRALPYLAVVSPNPLLIWGDPLIYEFVYGMLIALAFREGLTLPLWLAAISVMIGIGMIAWTGMDASGIEIVPRHLIWGGGAAFIVAGTALARTDRVPVGPAIAALSLLGDASYALYLLHTTIYAAVRPIVAYFFVPPQHQWAYAAILITTATGGAIAAYLLFERPLTKALQRRIATREAGIASAPAT